MDSTALAGTAQKIVRNREKLGEDMTEGTFELNKPGWYTPQAVQENDFLNQRLESEQYGIYYSVQFQGDAETYLWQAKTAPEVGKKYYGHIEQSKSGKSMRFKKDKEPEEAGGSAPGKSDWKPKNDYQITKNMVWKNLLGFYDVQTLTPDSTQWQRFWAQVQLHADLLCEPKKDILTAYNDATGTQAEPYEEEVPVFESDKDQG